MKQFFAFYNSGFDLELQAQTYADEALVYANTTGKIVVSTIVDVTTNDLAKKFWTAPNTIACVTVDDGVLKESKLNPSSLTDIDRMIDQL